eukprot:Colp12_sorted_trinity150504_noHs@19362
MSLTRVVQRLGVTVQISAPQKLAGRVIACRMLSSEAAPAGDGTKDIPSPTRTVIKRFYKDVTVKPVEGGYGVFLDQRRCKTPAKQNLVLPNSGLAWAIGGEWQAQDTYIRTFTMPFTGLAFTAIDYHMNRPRDDVIRDLMRFLNTDTVCCRDTEGSTLSISQNTVWGEYEDQFKEIMGVPLHVTDALIPPPQPEETQNAVRAFLEKLDVWQLTGFESAVNAAKSVVIPLVLLHRGVSLREAVDAARLEINLQTRMWGEVEYAHTMEEADTRARLGSAILFMRLASSDYSPEGQK